MADNIREVRVRLSVVGGPQFQQQFRQSAQSMGALGRSRAGVDQAGNSVVGFIKKAGAVAGVGLAVKSTIRNFGDFQQSLNQLQATGGATAQQMQQVQVKARELGKAVAGMSSTDAAQAMLELAKGGLSVDQSMQAATGTLNLAAAAQVDAAQAAGIQSAALNTFHLSADKANEVADILANTANAASGEITDFAQGLQQAGVPAAQLGISLGDTSTALGLFAKGGILGSDAGTSLKTMLISLLSPSKEQAAALEQLGVNAFDAQGNFVGLQAVSGQLADAQARLTTEQFNMAASTAFGTDAVRAAGVFANAGAQGFADLATQVTAAGGAQKMAEANTKGLSGALDKVKASLEDAQLQIGDKLAPQTEQLTNKIADLIPKLVNELEPALVGIGDAAVAGFDLFASGISSASKLINPLVQGVSLLTRGFASLPGPVQSLIVTLGVLALLRGKLLGMWTALKSGAINAVTPLRLAGLEARRVAATGAGPFRAMGAGLRYVGASAGAAGRGLSAAFGGPIGLAILGITTALSFMGDSSDEAEQHTEDLKSSLAGLDDVLTRVSGKFDTIGKAQLAVKFSANEAQFRALGSSAAEAAEMVSQGGDALAAYKKRLMDVAFQKGDLGLTVLGRGQSDLKDVSDLLGEVGAQSQATQTRVRALAETISTTLNGRVSADQIVAAFTQAEGSMTSAEDALRSIGVTGPEADTAIQQLGDQVITGAGNLHFFSTAAAEASQKTKEAGGAASDLADEQVAAGKSAQDYKDDQEAANAAVERAQERYDAAKDSLTPFEQASQAARDAQSALAEQIDRVSDALDRQKGILPSLDEAQLKAKDSAQELHDQFKLGTDEAIHLTDAFDKKTGRLKIDTAQQRDFVKSTLEMRDRMVEVATATYQAEVKSKGHTQAMKDAQTAAQGVRDDYVKSATAILGTGKAADQAADSVNAIPHNVAMKIGADNKDAVAKAKVVQRAADDLNRKKIEAKVTANKEHWDQTLQSIAVFPIPGKNIPVSAELDDFYDKLARIKNEPAPTYYVNVQGRWVGTPNAPGKIGSALATNADGSITQAANGLVRQAMIARGGANILWAEPETGWEAYIPGALSKRKRSLMLLSETARRMGKIVIDRPTAMAQGGITAMANGGLPSVSALAGIDPRQLGDRESRVVDALDALRQVLLDQKDTVRDSAAKSRDAAGKLAEAIAQQKRVRSEQASQVKDQKATNSAREKRAVEALEAARKKSDPAAIAKAEKALATARDLNARLLAQQVRQQSRANDAEKRKVDRARENSSKAAGTENVERQRLAAVENNYKVEAGWRAKQRALAVRYDQYVAAAAKTEEKLAGLRERDSELKEQGKQTALGIRGGLTGSADFQGTSVSSADVVKQLQGAVAGGKQWNETIAKARKNGISGSVLEQLQNDWEGKGGMVLRAIAAGKPSEAKQINSLYSQLGNYGVQAGGQLSAALGITKQIKDTEGVLGAQRAVITLTGSQMSTFADLMAKGAVAGMKGVSITASFGAGQIKEIVRTEIKVNQAKQAAKKYASGR